MARNSYGSLGRRSGNAAWQWVVIGVILGFACSATLVLGSIAAGVLSVSGQGVAFGATNTPIVITATPAPVTATETPTEALVTPTEMEVLIEAPSATPTTDPTLLTPLPSATPDDTATPPVGGVQPNGSTGGETAQIAAASDTLLRVASELVPVDGGTFQMGTTPAEAAIAVRDCTERDGGACLPAMAEDSYPQHPVVVSPFRMELTEVTYEQYLEFLNAMGPGTHINGCGGQVCLATQSESDTSNVTYDGTIYDVPDVINNLPVVEVTWFGAKSYCEALGRRLPTEAEWERAARGDDGRVYPWVGDWDPLLAWTNRSAPDDGEEGGAVPVESFPDGRSPYLIFNMAGNVAEWVSDWYDERYYYSGEATQPDPVGPPLGDQKVVRGGSWDTPPFFARTVHRQSRRPGDPTAWIGFRCAAEIETPGQPTAGQPNLPIGAEPLMSPTPDPATLGTGLTGDEGDVGNSAPTLAPRPTQPPQPTPLPPAASPTQAGTLAPG